MNKVLVAGIESVVGGNLAVCLSRTHVLAGVSLSDPISFCGCDFESLASGSFEAVKQLIERTKPQRIVFCGVGSESPWEGGAQPAKSDVEQASAWIRAASATNTHLTLISSGAVFTGPWMFHSENSQSFCSSAPAQHLRSIEREAAEHCPDALIVRTHAFGWKPGTETNWLDSLLCGNSLNSLDCYRHASPILASDLAEIIVKAWGGGLSGTYHIAGAERSNPYQFARRLSHHFQLPSPTAPFADFLVDRPEGYGCGETSLQTRKIRRALHIPLPMLEEGVLRLFQQHAEGYHARISGQTHAGSKVA